MVKVKICGITNLEDARASAGAGCDALGFVFYRKSPRYIAPQKAAQIIRNLPRRVIKIGVFANARENVVRRVSKLCHLDALQFHGRESPEFCARFKGFKIIKAFRVKDRIDLQQISDYKPFAYLFDNYSRVKLGGTGKKFDWRLIRHIDGLKRPVFLSGGLNEHNVEQAIRAVRPAWVDASSSLEISPGRKDHARIRKFVSIAKNTALS